MTSQQPTEIAASVETEAARPRGRLRNRVLWIAGPLVVALVAGWFYITAGRYT